MTNRRAVVGTYMDGFREGDHAAILAWLTDDVVWHVHGVRTTRGKVEFEDEIDNPNFEGVPVLRVEREWVVDDVLVTTGTGLGHLRGGEEFRFAFNDVFTFRGDLIAQLDSYIVPLP